MASTLTPVDVDPVVDAGSAEPYPERAEYTAAIDAIRSAAEAYYAGGDLRMDDAAYDALVARVAATEATNPGWAAPDSPTATVGAGVAVGDVEHTTPACRPSSPSRSRSRCAARSS